MELEVGPSSRPFLQFQEKLCLMELKSSHHIPYVHHSSVALSHMFAGSMNQGQSCGPNILENVRDGALSHKIDNLTYL